MFSQRVWEQARLVAEGISDKEWLAWELWQDEGLDMGMVEWSHQPNFELAIMNIFKGRIEGDRDLREVILKGVMAHYEQEIVGLLEAAKEQIQYERTHDETLRYLGEDRI